MAAMAFGGGAALGAGFFIAQAVESGSFAMPGFSLSSARQLAGVDRAVSRLETYFSAGRHDADGVSEPHDEPSQAKPEPIPDEQPGAPGNGPARSRKAQAKPGEVVSLADLACNL